MCIKIDVICLIHLMWIDSRHPFNTIIAGNECIEHEELQQWNHGNKSRLKMSVSYHPSPHQAPTSECVWAALDGSRWTTWPPRHQLPLFSDRWSCPTENASHPTCYFTSNQKLQSNYCISSSSTPSLCNSNGPAISGRNTISSDGICSQLGPFLADNDIKRF